jgi:hypothetical protein
MPTIEELTKENESLRAMCAAKDVALKHCRNRPHEHNPPPDFTITHCEVIDRALTLDCGKAITEELMSLRQRVREQSQLISAQKDCTFEQSAVTIERLRADIGTAGLDNA